MLKCGLLGEKLAHSYSPEIHGLFGNYEYRLYEKTRGEVPGFLIGAGFDGLNVTMPYKKLASAYCAALSADARAVGCVNTIVRRADGSLYGDNTDLFGFERMLAHSGVEPKGKKVLVLGSGGASATAVCVMRRHGAREVLVVSRAGKVNYQNLSSHADAQIIVNATPVGMYPNNGEAPVDLRGFPRLECVLDVVYNPARTALLLEAERLGIPCAGGLRMLVAQAKRSSELFTGEAIGDDAIARVVHAIGRRMENIVLIGMPGCGKTTLARALGAATGREAVDSDELICELAGMSIPNLFKERGEDGFRALETEALRRLGKRSGCIIATGGGCVTRAENYSILHQNSTIIWIKRDLAVLPREGRPLSMARDPAALYAERAPLYERFADAVVDNDGTVEDTTAKLLSLLQ